MASITLFNHHNASPYEPESSIIQNNNEVLSNSSSPCMKSWDIDTLYSSQPSPALACHQDVKELRHEDEGQKMLPALSLDSNSVAGDEGPDPETCESLASTPVLRTCPEPRLDKVRIEFDDFEELLQNEGLSEAEHASLKNLRFPSLLSNPLSQNLGRKRNLDDMYSRAPASPDISCQKEPKRLRCDAKDQPMLATMGMMSELPLPQIPVRIPSDLLVSVPMRRAREISSAPIRYAKKNRTRKACQSCHIRKIRCDDQRPCQRCKLEGFECVDYDKSPEKLIVQLKPKRLSDKTNKHRGMPCKRNPFCTRPLKHPGHCKIPKGLETNVNKPKLLRNNAKRKRTKSAKEARKN
mmetsp:Transcript_11984/g.23074  ORF Transcript_11984/g.23074 Transcript_11984/m.23074 type:complete len:352 (-) Transcript_11984:340-1395(-)|eukprot:CAMPEP_0170179122 /NCGR_PEP_ID=MMETSP0040_2-20121228/16191_1 /TAXON_ID=641309 /ORGANISM="Lotharella oceanica, Strain CCMP622" /LENGTH=351 /DNA_ID=CAMNT_0010422957 /DNA_START=468 /DNA_END=1523 /DNA_ORIENTATION=-